MGKGYLTALVLSLGLLAFNANEVNRDLIRRSGKTTIYQKEKPISITPIPLHYYKFVKPKTQPRVIRLPPVDGELLDGIRDGNSIRYRIEVEPNSDYKEPREEERKPQKPRKFYFNPEEPFGSQVAYER